MIPIVFLIIIHHIIYKDSVFYLFNDMLMQIIDFEIITFLFIGCFDRYEVFWYNGIGLSIFLYHRSLRTANCYCVWKRKTSGLLSSRLQLHLKKRITQDDYIKANRKASRKGSVSIWTSCFDNVKYLIVNSL